MRTIQIFFVISSVLLFLACNNNPKSMKNEKDTVKLTINKYPQRIEKSVIYEVNTRQYTPEGTFAAFEKHLPRLKELGVDILWFMPIQPIGEKNRKGILGSPYSIKNYTEVNPDYGTKEDFKRLVDEAHKNGMLVLIDWVANHSAWDNPWITEHPDWYVHDSTGQIISPVKDWADVADLNYDNPQMRKAMIDAMKYWVENFDIDGFRCDVAFMVPTDFWDSARVELDKVKPVFMLAEAEEPELLKHAFDMYYDWSLFHLMNDIAKSEKFANDLPEYYAENMKKFPDGLNMVFTSNHDENTWNGTVFERMPDSYKAFAALTFVFPDMPLIYSGQEACLNKRLSFFDKDTIDWKTCDMTELYQKLIQIRHENSALWCGDTVTEVEFIANTFPKDILTVVRQNDTNKILAIFNLSKYEKTFAFADENIAGEYTNLLDNQKETVENKKDYTLQPWEFKILANSNFKY